jgi:hypothetical protein
MVGKMTQTKLIRLIHKTMREMGWSKNSWDSAKLYDSWIWGDGAGMTINPLVGHSWSIPKRDEICQSVEKGLQAAGIAIRDESMTGKVYINFEFALNAFEYQP